MRICIDHQIPNLPDSAIAYEMTKPELRALLAFAPKGKLNAQLQHVHFIPQKLAALATDGCTLVVARTSMYPDRAESADTFVVERGALDDAYKAAKKAETIIVARHNEAEVEVYVRRDVEPPHWHKRVAPVDVPTPPFEAVIPNLSGRETVAPSYAVDCDYLSRACLVQSALDTQRPHVVFHQPNDHMSPIVIDAEDTWTKWTVVVMPVRDGRNVENVSPGDPIDATKPVAAAPAKGGLRLVTDDDEPAADAAPPARKSKARRRKAAKPAAAADGANLAPAPMRAVKAVAGQRDDGKWILELECGHTVARKRKGAKHALCPECAAAAAANTGS